MELYYRVRNVLHSPGRSAVTLDPVGWFRDSDTETVSDDEGGVIPALERTRPDDPSVVMVDDDGGPVTELRFDGTTDLRPRDLLILTVDVVAEPQFDPDGERIP